MNKYILIVFTFLISQNILAQKSIFIKFENVANGKKIVLNDSTYTNAFGEKYSISKLKYYVSNFSFMMDKKFDTHHEVNLIDASKTDSIILPIKLGRIWRVYFSIGVDSILNCSGAQEGALDPLNDMFWTWNSGYVNFKLEGKLLDSTTKLEHHIGGYKNPYKTMKRIFISLPQNYLKTRNTITIQMDLDKYWDSTNEIHLSEKPIITSVGANAMLAVDNFVKMFSLKNEN